ncbi:hypothetical protein [Streptomyces sp. NPDC002825]|uniref:hypothetical protein n=1 Tax=Streptomyces sp. NPDC002825 TaxID=3154666 RepID=UPI003329BE8A
MTPGTRARHAPHVPRSGLALGTFVAGLFVIHAHRRAQRSRAGRTVVDRFLARTG